MRKGYLPNVKARSAASIAPSAFPSLVWQGGDVLITSLEWLRRKHGWGRRERVLRMLQAVLRREGGGVREYQHLARYFFLILKKVAVRKRLVQVGAKGR